MQNNRNQKDQQKSMEKMAPPLMLFCRNWKSQHQILAFAIILFLLILCIVYLLSYYFLTMTISELQKASNLIFQQEKNKQIYRYSRLQLQITEQYFSSATSELQKLNEVFKITQKGINITQPSDCIFNFDQNDPYERSCQFCYGFCNQIKQTNVSDYKNMLNFSSTLTEYATLLDLSRQTYFTGIGEDQYFSMYSSPVKSDFQSHKRQWYLDHMAQMKTGNELIVSDPYYSQLNQIHMAQTYNLTNLKNDFIGIIAKDGDFSNMPRFKSSQIVPMLVNYKGDLVVSEYYSTIQNVLKFYQTNVTGFTEKEWNSIKETDLKEQETFTIGLYNAIYKQELLFSITDMKNPPFYILLYINDTEYNQDEKLIFAKFYEFQDNNIIYFIEITSVIVGILLIMQFISINLISRDLRRITSMTYQSIQSQGSKQNRNFKKINHFQNETIKNLFYAYKILVNSLTTQGSFRRNAVCKYLERIQYPFQHSKIDKQLFQFQSQMRSLIKKTENFPYHILNEKINQIEQVICKSLTELYKNPQ